MTANGDAPHRSSSSAAASRTGDGVPPGEAPAPRRRRRARSERPSGGKLRIVHVGDLVLPSGADSFLARKPWAVRALQGARVRRTNSSRPAPPARTCGPSAGWWRCRSRRRSGSPATSARCSHGRACRGRVGGAPRDLLKRKRKDDSRRDAGIAAAPPAGRRGHRPSGGAAARRLYAGDIDRLSVRATFPDLERWESWQGSLIRGSQAANRQSRKSDPGPMFVRPRGRRRPAHRCARHRPGLPCPNALLRIRDRCDRWTPPRHPWRRDHDRCRCRDLSVPAHEASRLLEDPAPAAAADLAGIPYASTGVVLMVYAEGTQPSLPEGTGFVVPRGLHR